MAVLQRIGVEDEDEGTGEHSTAPRSTASKHHFTETRQSHHATRRLAGSALSSGNLPGRWKVK